MRNQNNMDYAEKLYQEFQLPIIVAILFFMYQLPSVKKHIHKKIGINTILVLFFFMYLRFCLLK